MLSSQKVLLMITEISIERNNNRNTYQRNAGSGKSQRMGYSAYSSKRSGGCNKEKRVAAETNSSYNGEPMRTEQRVGDRKARNETK
jgi:hypothetical protein